MKILQTKTFFSCAGFFLWVFKNGELFMEETKKKSLMDRFLNTVEVAGNKLPDPATLFTCWPVSYSCCLPSLPLWGLKQCIRAHTKSSKS